MYKYIESDASVVNERQESSLLACGLLGRLAQVSEVVMDRQLLKQEANVKCLQ